MPTVKRRHAPIAKEHAKYAKLTLANYVRNHVVFAKRFLAVDVIYLTSSSTVSSAKRHLVMNVSFSAIPVNMRFARIA